jgi:hypothetical protein
MKRVLLHSVYALNHTIQKVAKTFRLNTVQDILSVLANSVQQRACEHNRLTAAAANARKYSSLTHHTYIFFVIRRSMRRRKSHLIIQSLTRCVGVKWPLQHCVYGFTVIKPQLTFPHWIVYPFKITYVGDFVHHPVFLGVGGGGRWKAHTALRKLNIPFLR